MLLSQVGNTVIVYVSVFPYTILRSCRTLRSYYFFLNRDNPYSAIPLSTQKPRESNPFFVGFVNYQSLTCLEFWLVHFVFTVPPSARLLDLVLPQVYSLRLGSAFFLASFLAYFFSLNAYKILFAPGYLNAGCSVSFFLRYRRTFNIQVQISLYYADFLLLYLGIPFCSIYFILFY